MSNTKPIVKSLTAATFILLLAACGRSSDDYTLNRERIGTHTNRDLCAHRRVAYSQCAEQMAPMQRHRTRKTAELTQEDRTVYFVFKHATLTPEAKERLDTLATALKSDQSVKEAKIVGYADRIGSETYNERLSQQRAKTVRDYLVANGYTNARVTETRWVGESEPSTNCPAEARAQLIKCLHNDRRVEVEIEYAQEGQMPDTR